MGRHGSGLFHYFSVRFAGTDVPHDIGGLVEPLMVSYINLSIHFVKNHIVLLIVYSSYIDSDFLILAFLTWESFQEVFIVLVTEPCMVLITYIFEKSEYDLRLVIGVSLNLQVGNEVFPVLSYLSEQLREDLNGLILLHFLMENAEVHVVFRRLPALVKMTDVYFCLVNLVLTEV